MVIVQVKNLRDRYNYLNNSKPKQGFKYKFIGDFNDKIESIKEHFKNELSWITYGEDSWIFESHGQVATHTLMSVPNFAQIEIPYQVNTLTDDPVLLGLCMPIIKELEELYNGKVAMCGFNKLDPGCSMPLHRDQIDGKQPFSPYYFVLRRFHIPIITNEKSFIRVNGEDKNMKVGECWEFNNNFRHKVWNNGDTDRIHFIIDILPYKWL